MGTGGSLVLAYLPFIKIVFSVFSTAITTGYSHKK